MAEGIRLAVILCAGRGGRLRPLTDDKPKCLLPVGGRPILERSLESLRACGIGEAVLVIGHRGDLIRAFVGASGAPEIRFVENPDFASTNTAVSLRLALAGLSQGFVLLNGDVVFDPGILADLLAHPEPNAVAIDGDMPLNEEEVKVIASGGRVARIGKDLDPGLCLGEAIGLYKIGPETIPELRSAYEDLESRGERSHFFEKGFDRVCRGGLGRAFGLAFTAGRPWVEIDTPEDFAHAERDIAPRLAS